VSGAEQEGTSMTESLTPWTTLRQVIFATDDLEADARTWRDELRLPKGFADPELEHIGIEDCTVPVSADAFIELVAPLQADSPFGKWTEKIGGRGGFGVSVQHPDLGGVRDRAVAAGVRVIVDVEAFGHPVIQLHPADMGMTVEVDGIEDPEVWFWDDLDVAPADDAVIDEVVGVEVPTGDPVALAQRWAAVLGLAEPQDATVQLGGRFVRFVLASAERSATDWTLLVRRADASEPEGDRIVAGIRFHLS
jgi:hypothetical protein